MCEFHPIYISTSAASAGMLNVYIQDFACNQVDYAFRGMPGVTESADPTRREVQVTITLNNDLPTTITGLQDLLNRMVQDQSHWIRHHTTLVIEYDPQTLNTRECNKAFKRLHATHNSSTEDNGGSLEQACRHCIRMAYFRAQNHARSLTAREGELKEAVSSDAARRKSDRMKAKAAQNLVEWQRVKHLARGTAKIFALPAVRALRETDQ